MRAFQSLPVSGAHPRHIVAARSHTLVFIFSVSDKRGGISNVEQAFFTTGLQMRVIVCLHVRAGLVRNGLVRLAVLQEDARGREAPR